MSNPASLEMIEEQQSRVSETDQMTYLTENQIVELRGLLPGILEEQSFMKLKKVLQDLRETHAKIDSARLSRSLQSSFAVFIPDRTRVAICLFSDLRSEHWIVCCRQ